MQKQRSERELVRAAVSDTSAREQLQKLIVETTQSEVVRFMRNWNISHSHKDELFAAASEDFDNVLDVYLKNGRALEDEEGHFPKYFRWCARQTMKRRAEEFNLFPDE